MAKTYTGISTRKQHTFIDRPHVGAAPGSMIKAQEQLTISHAIKGQRVGVSDTWYVLKDGTFMWSGGVEVQQEVPLLEKKLLVTVDDVGVLKEIDLGAKTALKAGWVNSIAVMVNKPDQLAAENWVDFLDQHKREGEVRSLRETTHVGLHFTIFSGKPILPAGEVRDLVDSKGFFKGYPEYGKEYEKDHVVKQVFKELNAQYKAFVEAFKTEPDYVNSHFDVLTFNEPFFKLSLAWAAKRNLAIRSHHFLPKFKRWLYDIPSKTNLPSIRKLNDWQKELGLTLQHPQRTFVNHYGPSIPGKGIKNYDYWVNKKQETLDKAMRSFLRSKDEYHEIVIHLIESDIEQQKVFVKQFKDFSNAYPGVNTKQFDGRKAEFLSLQKHSPWKFREELMLIGKS